MNAPTTMTPELLKTLRVDINAALAEIAKKHGVVVRAGNCSYTNLTATMKLEMAITGGDATVDPATVKARQDYLKNSIYFDLPVEWLDKSFVRRGGVKVTVQGLMPKRQKHPVLVKQEDGKQILLSVEEVTFHLKKEAVPA